MNAGSVHVVDAGVLWVFFFVAVEVTSYGYTAAYTSKLTFTTQSVVV